MNVLQLACSPIPHVRIALIGLGGRGMKTLERYAYIHGAQICYIVDLDNNQLDKANQKLLETGRPLAQKLQGAKAWYEACCKEDVDLVYICTEWKSHCMIATEAMKRGKHVAVEVPAATTIEECWQLVHTAEQTRRHLFMTENCCYDLFALETLEMKRRGVFGRITHCEGAYIHQLSVGPRHGGVSDTRHNWMVHSCAFHGGNPYPTHGIGPIGQLLGFHREDRMLSLVSVTSKNTSASAAKSEEQHVNTSLITTQNGVSILLQLDVSTPRPYSRMQTICGTKAYVQKYPIPTFQTNTTPPLTGQDAEQAMKEFATSQAAETWLEGMSLGVPNEMNYAMDARLIYCLQNGLPLDIDVYDAAEWSCIAELSQLSAKQGGKPVEFPRFDK